MTQDIRKEARELLAIEWEAAEHKTEAIRIRGGSTFMLEENQIALRAIEAALSLSAVRGVEEARPLREQLAYHQAEAHRITQQIVGDPSGGVIIGPDGFVVLSPLTPAVDPEVKR